MKVKMLSWALASSVLLAPCAFANDSSVQTQESCNPKVSVMSSGDVEGTASPDITKAEVRELERRKEKAYTSKQSVSERALMLFRGNLSY